MSQLGRVKKGLTRRARRLTGGAPPAPAPRPSQQREPVDESTPALTFDLDDVDARTWLILFGGRKNRVGLPPFEFFRVTQGIGTKRLFVRDLDQAWYHQGAREAGADIDEVAATLRRALDGQEHDRVVATGLSAGGYAALMFGTLLGVDTVLSFSPQTVIDPDVLAELDDQRWKAPLEELKDAGLLDPRWLDLRESLPRARNGQTRCEIHYDASFTVDRRHAERLANVDGVDLYPREGGGHNVPKAMRDSGELAGVLSRALGAEGAEG